MGLLDKLKSKAQDHIDMVKSRTSKQDILDLVSDCQKTIAEGGADDATKAKAAGKLLKGLAQMATGSYEGASRKLETVHKDPYDVQMAQETKDELNETLKTRLNARKFIYADPDTWRVWISLTSQKTRRLFPALKATSMNEEYTMIQKHFIVR